MKAGVLIMLLAVCALGASAGAGARTQTVPPISWGVSDDASKYADDGGAWFYGELQGANLSENRWTLAFDPANPTQIDDLPFLERAAPLAQAAGVHVLLSLYSKKGSVHDPTTFCTWAQTVAQTVSQWGIHDYIVWNEPNTRLYWSPQKDSKGRDIAAPQYEALMAACYDAIHGADPQATVIGMGLSPRASTPASNEPLTFLRDVGKAYRASGRTTPIMDELSIHPYPVGTGPPSVSYANPARFGAADLARVKQAVYDAFNGTGQPTTLNGLTFVVDEMGWQTDTTAYSQYVHAENVPTISEQTQASYLAQLATKYFACDPTVVSVELFLLVDEKYRDGRDESGNYLGGGWQSGLLTAGGQGVSTPKKAYTQDAPLFAEGRSACAGPLVAWSPVKAKAVRKPKRKAAKT
ncbi:MAG TPA: hypothetical protein VFA30_06785 [Gaiellaceae bacterium]|nr:hypothetical protein [Gaiellaceae bacterium]